MNLCLRTGKEPVLTIKEGALEITLTDSEHIAEKAEKRALTKEQVQKQLGKTGGTPFLAENISVDLEEGCTLSLSALNQFRRKALQQLAEEKIRQWTAERKVVLPEEPDKLFSQEPEQAQGRNGENTAADLDSMAAGPGMESEKYLAFYYLDGTHFNKNTSLEKLKQAGSHLGTDKLRAYVPLQTFMEQTGAEQASVEWEPAEQSTAESAVGERQDKNPDHKIQMIPYVLNISKGGLDAYIEEHLEEIAERTRECGIALGNLGWIEEFRSRGVLVYGDYGLNLYNRQAVKVMAQEGVRPLCLSLEKYPSELSRQDGSGSFPLMIMEHKVQAKTLTDRKNQQYKIVYNMENDKTILLPSQSEISLKNLKKRWQNEQDEVRVYIQ